MIRINIPGMYDSDSGGPRWGDAQIIDDGKNHLVIDGGCGVLTTRLIKRLKARQIKTPYLLLTHPHYDHYYGIRKIIADSYFKPKMLFCQNPSSLASRSNTTTLKNIIAEAKAKGIPVKYLAHKEHVVLGDLDFYTYRIQPEYSGNEDAYYNDGSLCTWFPALRYWTSGDGPQNIYDMCKSVGAKPVLIKIPHHGNACPRVQATGLKSLGTKYCWDNDYSTKITDFLQTGREDCIAVGMRYFNCHGDLNMIAQSGYVSIYKDYKVYRYKCAYTGKTALHKANLEAVKDVLKGKYGNNNSRITNLIDAGFYPIAVQNEVNEIVKLLEG